jgi:hypothetical protein
MLQFQSLDGKIRAEELYLRRREWMILKNKKGEESLGGLPSFL